MSAGQKGIVLRFGVKGEEDVRAAIGRLKAASRGLDAELAQSGGRMTAVRRELSDQLGGVLQQSADRAGGLGAVLRSVGPVGVGVAASVGAITVALGAAVMKAREAVAEFASMKDRADELRLSTDTLQTLDFAALDLGIDPAVMDQSIRAFLARRAQATQGEGELVAKLKDTDRAFLDQLRSLASNEDALRLLADRLKGARDEQDRLRIATAAFGEAGVRVSRAFVDGADGLDLFADRAREMGLIVDREVIAKAAEIDDQMQVASRAIDLNLKQAFIELAPVIQATLELALKVARAIRDVTDAAKNLPSTVSENRRANDQRVLADRVSGFDQDIGALTDQLAAAGDGTRKARALEKQIEFLREQRADAARLLDGARVDAEGIVEAARRAEQAGFRPPAPPAARTVTAAPIKASGGAGADRAGRVAEGLADQIAMLEDLAQAEGDAERAAFQRQQVLAAGLSIDSQAGQGLAALAGRLFDLREALKASGEAEELTAALRDQAASLGMTEREAFAYAQTQRLVGRVSDETIEKLRDQARALFDLEKARAHAEEVAGALGSALSRMPELARGGFKDIGSLFDDLAMDLADIAWRQLIVAPFEEALSEMLSSARGQNGFGGLANLISGLMGSLGSLFGGGLGGAGGLKLPPMYAVGTSFVPETGPAILHRGEMVLPAGLADVLRRPTGGGGSGGGINLNVINQAPGVEVARETGPDGSPALIIRQLESVLAGRIASGRGPLAGLFPSGRRGR